MTSFIEMAPIRIDAVKIVNSWNTAVLPIGSTNVKGIEFY